MAIVGCPNKVRDLDCNQSNVYPSISCGNKSDGILREKKYINSQVESTLSKHYPPLSMGATDGYNQGGRLMSQPLKNSSMLTTKPGEPYKETDPHKELALMMELNHMVPMETNKCWNTTEDSHSELSPRQEEKKKLGENSGRRI